MAQVALAWVLQKSEVDGPPIIGATASRNIDGMRSPRSKLKLTGGRVIELEAPLCAHAVAVFVCRENTNVYSKSEVSPRGAVIRASLLFMPCRCAGACQLLSRT